MSNGLSPTNARDVAAPAGGTEPARTAPVFAPATDIWETADRLVLVAEIPGADPEAVDVSVERGVLRVTARTRMTPPTGHSLIHAEYRDGDYDRAFTLPTAIDAERIEATVKDGLLRLVLPKAAPPRKIAVKAH